MSVQVRRGCVLGLTLLMAWCVLGGCAHLPDDRVDEALYLDLRRIVDTRERLSWLIDKVEYEAVADVALRSVCQVEPSHRQALAQWIDGRIALAGGSAREVYEKSGRDRDAIDELLTLERVRGVLAYAETRTDECPFWLEKDPDFKGVQSSGRRFAVVLESRGYAGAFIAAQETRLGGGGAGRLLPAWGINDRWLVATGFEMGGSGFFNEGGGSQTISTVFTTAIPLLVRIHDLSWVMDFEVAPVLWFTPEQVDFKPGVRAVAAIGLSTMRLGYLMPVGMLQVGYEYHPERDDGLPETHLIFFGTKVGFEVSF